MTSHRLRTLPLQSWGPADRYPVYERARNEAEQALADWHAAPSAGRHDAFVVYRAAAEREYAAGVAWMKACAAADGCRHAAAA